MLCGGRIEGKLWIALPKSGFLIPFNFMEARYDMEVPMFGSDAVDKDAVDKDAVMLRLIDTRIVGRSALVETLCRRREVLGGGRKASASRLRQELDSTRKAPDSHTFLITTTSHD